VGLENQARIILVALIIGVIGLLIAQKADCAFCAHTTCFTSSDCFSGCTCAFGTNEPAGTCFEVRD
jgi:hypothetical protein